MKQHIIIISLFLTVININAQSITSARSNTYESYVTKFGKPKKIIEKNTFYDKQTTRTKEIVEFSINLDTIKETRYTSSELDAKLLFVFNSKKQLIFRSYENKVPLIGWQYVESVYSYNENGLSEIKTTDSKGNLQSLTKVTCDTKGNPIELKLYDSNQNLIGFETGEYKYENNKWIYKVYNSNSKLISEQELSIENVKSSTYKYNKNGDCVLYPRNWKHDKNMYYQIEYKYDEFGNWTEQKIYFVEMINGKLKNKKKNRVFKRKLIYCDI